MPNAAPRRWTRTDLPIEVRFGMRPPYALIAFLVLLGFATVHQEGLSDPYVLVPIVLLAGILVVSLGLWLIPVLRGTAGGTLRIGQDKIAIIRRGGTETVDLATCRSFRLSPTRNRISFATSAGDGALAHVDHLRLSREELQQIVDLLNYLCGATEAVQATGPSDRHEAVSPPPQNLRGPRLAPMGLYRYALRTTFIVGGAAMLCLIVFVPLALNSLRCSEPVTDACRAIAPIAGLTFVLMIPAIPFALFVLRRYRATAQRLRDLDELPTRAAVWRAMIPFTASRDRVVSVYGTPGPNRFGPPTE